MAEALVPGPVSDPEAPRPYPPGVPRPWRAAEGAAPELERRLQAVASEPDPLGFALRYVLSRPGKRARGRLAIAACTALRAPRRAALELALGCELIHEASLVHDDLQDRDTERRGQPAAWALFGDELAINLGDFLMARAFDVAAGVRAPEGQRGELVRAFTSLTLDVIRGQVADNTAAGDASLELDRYERIARAKTGPLLALPVEGALILAGAERGHRSAAREALGWLGAAYQVQDDLADLFGRKQRGAGGEDVREGRPSAPVLHFLAAADGAERARFAAFRAEADPQDDEVDHWLRRIRASDAVDRSVAYARALSARGLELAETLPADLAAVLRFADSRMNALLRELEQTRATAGERSRGARLRLVQGVGDEARA